MRPMRIQATSRHLGPPHATPLRSAWRFKSSHPHWRSRRSAACHLAAHPRAAGHCRLWAKTNGPLRVQSLRATAAWRWASSASLTSVSSWVISRCFGGEAPTRLLVDRHATMITPSQPRKRPHAHPARFFGAPSFCPTTIGAIQTKRKNATRKNASISTPSLLRTTVTATPFTPREVELL